jgi:pyrophosphate--fructose-6-phosphate 1-phosphotransferase
MSGRATELQQARAAYVPRLPPVLRRGIRAVALVEGPETTAVGDREEIAGRFPHSYGLPTLELEPGGAVVDARPLRVGVVLSGGQAPGGHNVITGLFDALMTVDPASRLFGFLGGPRGIFDDDHRELTGEGLMPYRNTGGFDLIGSGRDKIETPEQLAASRATSERLKLDGLVVIGGDDSNTNAAVLAEYFLEHGVSTAVAGVPKTIDGDLKGNGIETSFGFDTATKVYSELIGNICRDALSAGKYWHFVKLMGRNASHVTLECALETRPNVALIGEEVRQQKMTLDRVVEQIADVVCRRAETGKRYGVCLVPEGLIEFVPEIRALIDELNALLSRGAAELDSLSGFDERAAWIERELGGEARATFGGLPERIRRQLLLDRDSHGNVQVSKIDTEALVVERVRQRIEARRTGSRFGGKWQVQGHFFGYEGRSGAPSNFDADYTYSLGHVAAALIADGRTGYLCCVRALARPADDWRPAGVPLTSLMQIETRKGRPEPVIAKALVSTDAEPFLTFAAHRDRWAMEDAYRYPGAIQYFGPPEVCDRLTRTLVLEHWSRP